MAFRCLMMGCLFVLQYAIKLDGKVHQPVRIGFILELFGKMPPITRLWVIGNRPSVLPVFLRFSGFRAMPVHAVVRRSQFPTRFTGRVVAIGRAEHLHWRWSKDFSIYLLGCHIVLPRFQNVTLNPKWKLFKIAHVRARANFRRSYRRRRPIVIPQPYLFVWRTIPVSACEGRMPRKGPESSSPKLVWVEGQSFVRVGLL